MKQQHAIETILLIREIVSGIRRLVDDEKWTHESACYGVVTMLLAVRNLDLYLYRGQPLDITGEDTYLLSRLMSGSVETVALRLSGGDNLVLSIRPPLAYLDVSARTSVAVKRRWEAIDDGTRQ